MRWNDSLDLDVRKKKPFFQKVQNHFVCLCVYECECHEFVHNGKGNLFKWCWCVTELD